MNFNNGEVISLQTSDNAPAPKRAKRSDAVANRELIMATAQGLFAKHGVSNICMAAIAEAAGVGKGTLYRAFANKGELCLAFLDEDMQGFQNDTLRLLKANYKKPALFQLDAFLDRLVHFMEFHAPLLQEAQAHNVFDRDEFAQNSPHMWQPWLRQTIGNMLVQAMKNGEAIELDVPYLVDAILAPLNANLFIYQRESLGFNLQRISNGVRGLVLDGCRKKE